MLTAQAKVRDYNQRIKSADTEEVERLKKKRNKQIGLVKEYEAYIEKYALHRDFRENIGAYVDDLVMKGEIKRVHEKTRCFPGILSLSGACNPPSGAV